MFIFRVTLKPVAGSYRKSLGGILMGSTTLSCKGSNSNPTVIQSTMYKFGFLLMFFLESTLRLVYDVFHKKVHKKDDSGIKDCRPERVIGLLAYTI